MQLLIDIPEDTYNYIKRLNESFTDYQTTLILYSAVKQGKLIFNGQRKGAENGNTEKN